MSKLLWKTKAPREVDNCVRMTHYVLCGNNSCDIPEDAHRGVFTRGKNTHAINGEEGGGC